MAIRITVGIPGAVSGADDYVVVRIHEENGEIVVMIPDTICNAEAGTVTFETDEFSTCAIVALNTAEDDTSASEDAKTDAGLPDSNDVDGTGDSSSAGNTSGAESESPKTADSAPIYMVMLLMLCTVCGCAVLVIRRRRI